MNTKMVYELKFYIRETQDKFIIQNVKMKEEEYAYLLEKLETSKFVTIINNEQDSITINVGDIHRIETVINIEQI